MQTSTSSNITLADGVGHTFFRVIAWRTKKRCSVEFATDRPTPASSTRSSSSVISLRASHSARMSARRSSMRCERMSPPCGLGAKLPVARRCACHRIAGEGATPNRAAAARQLVPASIAASSRVRKSIERG